MTEAAVRHVKLHLSEDGFRFDTWSSAVFSPSSDFLIRIDCQDVLQLIKKEAASILTQPPQLVVI